MVVRKKTTKKATTRRTATSSESKFSEFIKAVKGKVFSSHGFPIFLGFTLMGVLFVLFRMKSIEIDYKISNVNKEIEKVTLENKELKAIKAKMLSVSNLKAMAKKYNLKQPRQKQIIVIR